MSETDANTDTLTITDNRTGKSYEVPIVDGAIRSLDLRQIKVSSDEFGLLAYDPAFMNTASCRSSITYLDGDQGVLEYRGYPIEQLAENSTYLEVAYLLHPRRAPDAGELEVLDLADHDHTFVHENVKEFMQGFRYDAHPMGMLLAARRCAVDLLPGGERRSRTRRSADMQVIRLIAKMPTLAAFSYRHQTRPSVRLSRQRPRLRGQLPARHDLQDDRAEVRARPACRTRARRPLHPPRRPRAELLDERGPASAPRTSIRTRLSPPASPRSTARCTAAPTRRSADAAADRHEENIPAFIEGVKEGKERLMGFGHRVYKNYDPRARIIKRACDDVFEVTGENPLLQSPPSSRRSRSRTTTSCRARSIRTLTSTPA